MNKITPKVSVILPFYGSFNRKRIELTIASIRAQKGVDLEIIVSEQGSTPTLENIERIKYTFTYYKTPNSDFNTGEIRNAGVKIALGEYVYANDADIVFLDENYLINLLGLLEKDSSLVLYRPVMRRLPLENFDEFYNRALNLGIIKAIKLLDYSQPFLAKTDNKEHPLKIVVKKGEEGYDKIFTTSMENFYNYISNPALKGKEPLLWYENLHCGGTFLRRKHFDFVGGYCKEYLNWGCEDADLQWKLSKCFKLEKVPTNFEVLHLDHPKGYFYPEMWKRNQDICSERMKSGIDNILTGDRQRWQL